MGDSAAAAVKQAPKHRKPAAGAAVAAGQQSAAKAGAAASSNGDGAPQPAHLDGSPNTAELAALSAAGNSAVAHAVQSRVPQAVPAGDPADAVQPAAAEAAQPASGLPAGSVAAAAAPGPAAAAAGASPADTEVIRAVEAFANANPDELKRVIGDWNQRSFGDVNASEGTKRSVPLFGEVETIHGGSAGAGGGFYGGASAGRVDMGLVQAYQVLVEAGFVAGAELKLSGEVKKFITKTIYTKAQGSLGLFVGTYARVQGQASLLKGEEWWERGASVSGQAGAFSGAKGSADASFELGGNSAGLNLGAEGALFVGAEASAEGEATIDLASKTIAISGEASAFVGVRASGAVRGKTLLYGREALSGKVAGEVSAGAGGGAKVGFSLKRGVLKLDLGAKGAVGLGAGVEGEVGIDFKPIAVFISRQTSKVLTDIGWIKVKSVEEITDPNGKLRKGLRAYHMKKLSYLRAGKADEYVKIEKVQAYIDAACGRQKLKKTQDTTRDAAIKQAVEEEFRTSDGLSVTVDVLYGKLTRLDVHPDDAVARIKRGERVGTTYSNAPVVAEANKDLRTLGN